MAVLGSTSEPTAGDVWYGLNVQNQFSSSLTLPAGGPWRIYRLGVWMAGKDETARTRLCLWDSSNNLQRQSAEFTAPNRALGNPASNEQDITDYEVAGGTTVQVGFHSHSDDNRQFPHNSGGSRKEKTTGDSPVSMASATSLTGSMGVWLYYELANSVPNAPTIDEPDQNEVVNDTTPLIDWTHSDPDGDAQSGYQVQIDDSSGFGSPAWDSGNVTSATTQATCGVALNRGTTYYVRVRTRDAEGFGPWSSTRTFKIASTPTVSITAPSADGVAAPMYYTAGSDTTPKFRIGWTMTCPDGGTQASATIRIKDAAGTSTLHTHAHSGSAGTADISGYAPANGTEYTVTVQSVCSHGVSSTETTATSRSMRARWGRASYRADLGATPTTLSVSSSSTANSGAVVLEYGSTAGTTPEPTDWKATIAEVTKQRYVWHRVTLLPQAVAAPTSPALNSVTFTYSANVLTPDDWTLATIAQVDQGTFVYGTQSIKHSNDGTSKETYQDVSVVPNTDYIFSGRMKTQGNALASLVLRDVVGGVDLVSVAALADTDWTRYATAVWNSGEMTSVRVILRSSGAAATAAWYDALKLEASKVVTPWTPGFLGEAVVLDAGGLQVDAGAGGVFRLRGSAGGVRDVMHLGANGLIFGGDMELRSSAATRLEVYSAGVLAGGFVPSGGIIAWSGQTTAIPAGWFLCDGSNGTPDLRDRFIIGADTTNEATSGGTVSPSAALAHTAHGHPLDDNAWAQTNVSTGVVRIRRATATSWTPTVGRLFTDAGSSTPAEAVGAALDGVTADATVASHAIPKFFRLAYIMKA